MSIIKRDGTYGFYYTSNSFTYSAPLNDVQMETNALYIYAYFHSKGWTLNAICGMLGNMSVESSLNPGRWQSDTFGMNGGGGYGLVQWTPYTNYTNWVDSIGSNEYMSMDNNLDRIMYEFENNLQYFPTNSYPETFEQFSKSNKSLEYLTTAFLRNYERAGVEHIEVRINFANRWYAYLLGFDPNPPIIINGRRKGFNFVLFGSNRKRRLHG